LKQWSLGFFEDARPNKNTKNKISSDMRSVPDLKKSEVVLCEYTQSEAC